MFQAEYIRDMHNNYLVITGIKESDSSYGVKMLLNNTIPGFLKAELRCIDQLDLFYYDVTSLKTIAVVYENNAINYNEIKDLLSSVLCTIEHGGEFLLSENDFIVDPEFIFINTDSQTISLCHLVGHQVNIREQISRFIEYLMNKVDYQDERAVLLIYAMYKVSKEVDCTFEKLLLELNNKFTGNTEQNELNKQNSRNYHKENTGIKTNHTIKYSQSKSIETKNDKTKNLIKDNIFKNIFHTSLIQKKTAKNCDYSSKAVRVIPEEIENEHEISYFGYQTYLLAGVAITAGAVLLILAIKVKFLQNSFGTQIDMIKLLCSVVIIGMVEILVLTRLFDKKNQITRIEMDLEYINPDANVDNYIFDRDSSRSFRNEKEEIKLEEIEPGEMSDNASFEKTKSEETALLWMKEDSGAEQTIILAELHTQKQYYLEPYKDITAIPEEEKTPGISTKKEEAKDTLINKETVEKESINVNIFPFIIGKSKLDVNYKIDDKSVSRKHAKFTYNGGTVYITDMLSTNGTYVNGIRLKDNEAYPLSVNDEIAFSNIKFCWKEK